MRRVGPVMAIVVLISGLAGCFGADDTPVPEPLPPVETQTPEPEPDPVGPVIPPCALQPGDVGWIEGAGAPKTQGVSEAVIKRDAYGVPHIYADDAYTLYFANGYVQAQDRLFELDLLRHVGRGDSARIVGASQLSSDLEVHRELYSEAEIEAQWAAAPDFAKEILIAYSDGVNRHIQEATATNQLPGEFAAVGHQPEPWTPQDTVAVVNYLIGFFGVDGGHELGNLQRLAQLESVLPADQAWDAFGDLVWTRIDDGYTTIAPEDKIVNGCEDPLPRESATHQLRFLNASLDAVTFGTPPGGDLGYGPLPPGLDTAWGVDEERKGEGAFEGFKWGSNALLVDGSKTATGKPIMWGAPQMGYYKPPVPYQVGLHGAGFDAVGIGVAGAPGIVIGRNADIAWSATSGIEDQKDLVELELDGPRSYLWDGESRAMDCWFVEHQTAPAPADLAAFPDVAPPQKYVQEVCRAESWPVVAINEEAGVAWMAKWTTRNEELPGAMIWLDLATATSAADFHERTKTFPFTFNFHVADANEIRYIHTGNIPLRSTNHDVRLPTPSGDAHDWTGEVVTGGMGVWANDPERGYFANWNNGPAFGWRAGDQRGLWGPVHRVQAEDRVVQAALERTGGQLTWQDVADANWAAATTDSLAAPFMPHLIEAAQSQPDTAPLGAALEAWAKAGLPWRDDDGDGAYDDPGHAIWDVAYAEMLRLIQGDELGELNHELALNPPDASDAHAGDHGQHNNPLPTVLKALRGTASHDWCDDVTTEEVESCTRQLVTALRTANETLTATYGADIAEWLEPIHHSEFTSLGASTPNAMPMVNRGSWVQVVAMGQGIEGAGSAMPPSNSGFIDNAETARWVADGTEPARLTLELDMYWSNEYKPFALTAEEVDAVAVSTSTLTVLNP